MKNQGSIVLILLIFILSCKNDNAGEEKADNHTFSAQEQVYHDSIMTIHDRVMPRMTELETLRRRLTIEREKYASPEGNQQQLVKVNSLLGELNKSENAMWDWMHNYQPDSMTSGSSKLIYLKRELHSVRRMEELFISGIAKAGSYFSN